MRVWLYRDVLERERENTQQPYNHTYIYTPPPYLNKPKTNEEQREKKKMCKEREEEKKQESP